MKTNFGYKMFAIIGLIGFIDFLSGYIGQLDMGLGSMIIIAIFGSTIAVPFILIMQFWWMWLIFAYFSRPKKLNK